MGLGVIHMGSRGPCSYDDNVVFTDERPNLESIMWKLNVDQLGLHPNSSVLSMP